MTNTMNATCIWRDIRIMVKKYREYYALFFSAIIIALVTGISLFERGIGGDVWDLTYHLLRIESVKEALLDGSYPARVNPIFFDGYGYGSSLFYPDIFLIVPAVMNILGVSLLLSYKLFLLMITVVGTGVNYFALKFLRCNKKCALAGSYIIMLSTYYLADVSNRAGLSEYIACIFVPVLAAAIYDYFGCEGKRTWLFGVAFVGMALCHTIMTFIGLLITVVIFLGMLLIKNKRCLVFEKRRFGRLVLTALLSLLITAYYIFPMLEQMISGKFGFNKPWAHIGDFTQPMESFFAPIGLFMNSAEFGVGIPVLFLLISRVMLGKVKNKWADFCLYLGIALLLVMTDIIPWERLEETALNMIQFTYRYYPYALFFLVCGTLGAYTEKEKDGLLKRYVIVVVTLLAVICGIWQNIHCTNFGTRVPISREYVYANNHWVGKGEWVPEGVTEEIFNGQGSGRVVSEDGIPLRWQIKGYNSYSFEVAKDMGRVYEVPLLYYKGYYAQACLDDGTVIHLEVGKSPNGLVKVELPTEIMGTIEVWYKGTMLQNVMNVISAVVLLGVLAAGIYELLKNKRKKTDYKCENNA